MVVAVARKRQGGAGEVLEPLERYLRRRRRQPWWLTLAVLVVVVLIVWADRRGAFLHEGDDLSRYDGRVFEVERVIDGDTLDVVAPDPTEPASPVTRVRLWGIDSPERARESEGRPAEPFAEAATQRADALADDQRVTLTLEPHRVRDRYGRVLAFVTLPDGAVLNEVLLTEGLARADDRWPHRDRERYGLLELQAQKRAAGLWSERAVVAEAKTDGR